MGFVNKEGKWFNNINRLVDLSLQQADTSDFTFQGIGFINQLGIPGCIDPTATNYNPNANSDDGSCNISLVDAAIKRCFDFGVTNTVVIKSTIPPGTTQRLNDKYDNFKVVFNPEFLTEANAVKDYENQNRIILGGPRPATTKLRQVFAKVFPKAHIIKTDSTHAEMVKYLTNSFLATKVSFANEMHQICDKLDIDYDKVVEYGTLDPRLGSSHWSVPGPDGDFGYGGHCFPKDTEALLKYANDKSIKLNMLKKAVEINKKIR